MEIWVEDASGVVQGDGPITTAEGWQASPLLDRAGSWSFRMPAADPRAALVVPKLRVRAVTWEAGYKIELGYGIINVIELDADSPEWLTVSGVDRLGELAGVNVGDLSLTKLDHSTASLVEEVPLNQDPPTTLTNAYDANLATFNTVTLTKEADAVYVHQTRTYHAVKFTLGTNVNTTASDWRFQYLNSDVPGGSEDPLTIISDTTRPVGTTRTFGQSGEITFEEPFGWAGPNYRIRIWPVDADCTVDFVEIETISEVPTEVSLASLIALSDTDGDGSADWELDPLTGYYATGGTVYLRFNGESLLSVLIKVAEAAGEHFRLSSGQTIAWLRKYNSAKITVNTPTNTYYAGEPIAGSASGATAVVGEAAFILTSATRTGALSVGERVRGSASGAIGIVIANVLGIPHEMPLVRMVGGAFTATETIVGLNSGNSYSNITVSFSYLYVTDVVGTFVVGETITHTATTKVLLVSNQSAAEWVGGETVTGTPSGATGVLAYAGEDYLVLTGVVGTFTAADSITGGTGGRTADVDSVPAAGSAAVHTITMQQSGKRAEFDVDPIAAETNDDIVLWTALRETRDASGVCSRVYPHGGGQGDKRISLEHTTRVLPAGYEYVNDGDGKHVGIRRVSTEGWAGRIDNGREAWPEIVCRAETDLQRANASDALCDRALEWLRTHSGETAADVPRFYSLDVTKIRGELLVGQTLQVVAQRFRQGSRFIDIDAELVITGISYRYGREGVIVAGLQVATVDRQPETDATIAVRQLDRNAANMAHAQPAAGVSRAAQGVPTSMTVVDGVLQSFDVGAGIDGVWTLLDANETTTHELTFKNGLLIKHV